MLFFRELKFLFFWEIPNHTAAAWCAAEQCLRYRWLSQRALSLTSGSGRWVQEMQKFKALYPLKHISSWWPGRRLTVLSFICSKSTFVKQTLCCWRTWNFLRHFPSDALVNPRAGTEVASVCSFKGPSLAPCLHVQRFPCCCRDRESRISCFSLL